MSTELPKSGLKTTVVGESGWLVHHNDNWERLNNVLLKLSALLDVDTSGISAEDILRYNSSSQKWEPKTHGVGHIPTTTT